MLTFEGYNRLPGKKNGVRDIRLPFEVRNEEKPKNHYPLWFPGADISDDKMP